MKYWFEVLLILFLLTFLLALGYGAGFVGETVYNSDSITIER